MAKTILVIEDDDLNRYLLSYYLRENGYTVVEAASGAQGVEHARQIAVDLILLDLHLPRMDGFAVIRELHLDPRLRSVPVVAVTASAMAGDRERVLAQGFADYLEKPIDLPRLKAMLEAQLPSGR